MKKRNIATAMAAAMMFGGVAPVVAHADNGEAVNRKVENTQDANVVDVALANGRETTTKTYKEIYNTQFTDTTSDDKLKGDYEILYTQGTVGSTVDNSATVKFLVTTKVESNTTNDGIVTKEKVKLENTEDYINNLVNKGYYTKTEKASLVDKNDLAKGTQNVVTLKITEAGKKAGRTDEVLTYTFKNVPVQEEKDIFAGINFPSNIDVSTNSGVAELNKFVYDLNKIKSDIIVDKSENNDNLILKVYKKDKDGKKTGEAKTVELLNFKAFKKSNYKGYVEIPVQNDFDNQYYTWANTQIVDAMANGVIDASSEFRPEDAVTRAEFAKILMNSIPTVKKDATNEDLKITKSFKDINKSDWYYDYVMPLAELGIVSGFEGEFRPNDTITREEAAVMLATATNRAENKAEYSKVDTFNTNTGKNVDVKTTFKDDKSIADWADEAVLKTSKEGKIKGYEDNTFRPQNNITRAETVVMLERASK